MKRPYCIQNMFIPKEYTILELLMRYPNRLFSRCEIVDKLWEIERVITIGDRRIITHITNLRSKPNNSFPLTL